MKILRPLTLMIFLSISSGCFADEMDNWRNDCASRINSFSSAVASYINNLSGKNYSPSSVQQKLDEITANIDAESPKVANEDSLRGSLDSLKQSVESAKGSFQSGGSSSSSDY